ncbi:hypothetical protein CSC12_1319 [Klebsiella michiganensis]|nr:hypothetical protein A225_3428 [Klebsiella michiganensis E718]AWF50840.1 hypothetical protein CSC12_1319 [Klebsiella michiganensis]
MRIFFYLNALIFDRSLKEASKSSRNFKKASENSALPSDSS